MKAIRKAVKRVPGYGFWLVRLAVEHTGDLDARWDDPAVMQKLTVDARITSSGLPRSRSEAVRLGIDLMMAAGWDTQYMSPLGFVSDGVAVLPVFRCPDICAAMGGFASCYGVRMDVGVLRRTLRAFKGLRRLWIDRDGIYRPSIRSRLNRKSWSEEIAEPLQARLRRLPLTPEAFKYSRGLGVEIEGVSPHSREAFNARLPFWCRVADDSSIRASSGLHSHEVRCLLNREIAEPRLAQLCKTLESLDLRVNASCGLHLHFDMRGKAPAEVVAKARVVDKWLSQLVELLPPSRRSNDFCKFGVSTTDRYRAVNVTAFSRHRTLEIRCHSSTRDYTKILSWIRLCELLLALRRKPKPASCLGTLDQLPLTDHDRAYWQSRHRFLNPAQYSNPSAQNGEGESA